MVYVKVIHVSHASGKHAALRLEEEINEFLNQKNIGVKAILKEVHVASTTHKDQLCFTATITYLDKDAA